MEFMHHIFHTDQEAMFLQEIGLGYHLKELVTEHIEFFKAKDRRTKFKELIGAGDEHEDIRSKMLAVLFNTDYVNLSMFIHSHSAAFIDGNEKFDKDLDCYALSNYYWGKIKYQFNFTSETPTIYGFLLELFNSKFSLGYKSELTKESRLLLALWEDTIQRQFWSHFRIAEEAIGYDKVIQLINKRENKFWYKESEALYNGWKVLLRQGLDIWQKTGGWYDIN
jgi:hypothetical protein